MVQHKIGIAPQKEAAQQGVGMSGHDDQIRTNRMSRFDDFHIGSAHPQYGLIRGGDSVCV